MKNPFAELSRGDKEKEKIAYSVFAYTLGSPAIAYIIYSDVGINGVFALLWISWWVISAAVFDRHNFFKSRFLPDAETSRLASACHVVIVFYAIGPWLIVTGTVYLILKAVSILTHPFGEDK
jgi:hypothetical protein